MPRKGPISVATKRSHALFIAILFGGIVFGFEIFFYPYSTNVGFNLMMGTVMLFIWIIAIVLTLRRFSYL